MGQTLGDLLRQRRGELRWSLRDVAQQTGLSNGYLSLLEHDKVKQPKPPVLYTLAEALDLPYPQLMGLAGYAMMPEGQDGPRRTGQAVVVFKGAEKLTDDQREDVQEFINFKLQQLQRSRRQRDGA